MLKKIKTDLIIYKVYDTIVKVQGSYNFQIYETVRFEDESLGYVINIKNNKTSIAMLDGTAKIGDTIYPTTETFFTYVLSKPFGKMFDATGLLIKDFMVSKKNPIDLNFINRNEKKMYIFEEPKGIYARDIVCEPLYTGTLSIDTMIPIGKGQRELILGDKKTGKTSIAMNMFISQKETNVINIYVAIGKTKNEIIDIVNTLKIKGVLHKTIIIAADAEANAAKKIIAPYTAMAFARFFSQQGRDVLIVLDDLSIHADAHRELSLLAGFSPGREAYPGDVFFMHSKLLENAGKYNHILGGGSITAIPIVETQEGDISGYIPTNVISITDGQIYTSKTLFNKRIIPAIDITQSVSRVGSSAQTIGMRSSTSGLKMSYINYNEQTKMSSFGANLNLDQNTLITQRGKVLYEISKQDEYDVIGYGVIAIMSIMVKGGYLDFYSDDMNFFSKIKEVLISFLKYDVLGTKISEVLSYTNQQIKKNEFDINEQLLNKYLIHIILPLLKYHIIQNIAGINKNKSFIEKYGPIRTDSRILLSYKRKKYDIGIAYDYQL